jgi:glycosyltransferase involved in cell wall biosynthesis
MSKVCIYCIAKNEEAFVERFMARAGDADLVVIGDTGSTDGTVAAFRRCGAVVHNISVSPWRFDAARNQVIDLIPEEYDCLFSVDIDETLETPDWKDRVLSAWEGNNRVRYWYSWSLKPDGTPDRRFVYDKIHSRDFHWVSPVHEVLELAPGKTERGGFAEIELYHRPDCLKSRGSYLGLLETAVKERPTDDRMLHYYGRELYFVGRDPEAILLLLKHSELEHAWAAERAASCRMAGECSMRLGRWAEAEWFYAKGVSICPQEREPLVALAKFYLSKGEHAKCYKAAMAAASIQPVTDHYLVDPYAHNEGPYDLAGVSAWWMGNKAEGQQLMEKAVTLNPKDQRLRDNLAFFTPDPTELAQEAIKKWYAGDLAGARQDYATARKLDPENYLVVQNRAWFPDPIIAKPGERKQGIYKDARISVLVASQGRPDLAQRLQRSAISTAGKPDLVEVLVATDNTDARQAEYRSLFGESAVVVGVPTMLKWNQLAGRSRGDILVMVCDDVIFESDDWDERLRELWPDDGVAVMYSDSGSGCMLCEFPIVSRTMVGKVGYAAYPGLFHSGLDLWWQSIGEDLGRLYYLGEVWRLRHAHVDSPGIRDKKSRYKDDAKRCPGGVLALDPERRNADTDLLRGLMKPKIPVIIMNRDLLTWPKAMVEKIEQLDGVGEIIIVDNASTYEPLLQWYSTNPCRVVRLQENLGHLSAWSSGVVAALGDGPYVVTDPDLGLDGIPNDALTYLRDNMLRLGVEKIGFGLDWKCVTPQSPYWPHLMGSEKTRWERSRVDGGVYLDVPIDTTFAMYSRKQHWYGGASTGEPYVAKHFSWYLTPEARATNNEFTYYLERANASCSYKTHLRLGGA